MGNRMKLSDPDFGKCVRLEEKDIAAVIAPEMGMAMISFTVKGEEILDQSRKDIFLKCRKGLGPLILPHFNQQVPAPDVDVSAIPHVEHLKALGIKHPFQHGIGRYAPWRYMTDEKSVSGTLSGEDLLNGLKIRELNGSAFKAQVTYRLFGGALEITLGAEGERPVQAGIHFYYDLKNRATARAFLPVTGGKQEFRFDQAYDLPLKPEKTGGEICYRLETRTYSLDTVVAADGPPGTVFEDVIIFSPENAPFTCLEPLSNLERERAGSKFKGMIRLKPSSRQN